MRIIGKIKDLGKRNPSDTVIRSCIGEDSSGQRIDNFLFKCFRGVPKSHIYQLLRSGQVRINSKRVNAKYRLQLGDTIRIPPIRKTENGAVHKNHSIRPDTFHFRILFQDEALLVIDKPAGMAVHGGSGVSFGVIEQLRAQNSDWKFLELVHRLDRETSGVLLLAKKRNALVTLHQQFREGKIQKRYLVLVKGKWRHVKQNAKFSLRKYITQAGERRVAVVTNEQDKQNVMPAHTIFRLRKSWKNFSLLEAELKTGRTHQIRVHLAHLGFPIIGDDKYGDFALNKEIARKSHKSGLTRMFLHAYQTAFIHPLSGVQLHLEAPLANDLQVFLNEIEQYPNNADPIIAQ